MLPKFVLNTIINLFGKSKKKSNSKTVTELAKQVKNLIDIFSLKYIDVMKLITFAKELINNTSKGILILIIFIYIFFLFLFL